MARKNGSRPALPVTKLYIRGFKSIRDEIGVALCPLTILAGANSGGKSSVVQPLLLLKQTLDVSYDPGPLLLSGANVKFSEMSQVLWRGKTPKDSAKEFAFGFETRNGRMDLVFARRPDGHGAALLRIDVETNGKRTVIREGGVAPTELVPGVGKSLFERYRPVVMRERFWLSVGLGREGSTPQRLLLDAGELIPGRGINSLVRRSIHVPGLRGHPERAYPTTEVGDHFPGAFQNYIASILTAWHDGKKDELEEAGVILQALGLSWKVEPRRIDDTSVELRVGRLREAQQGGAKDLVSIADVGFGVSQVLPVIIALLVAKPGQVVYIEQPEIHLHPKAQVALGKVLLDAARRGVLVIAETHSHLLLKGVQVEIAKTHEADLVALHWLSRDKEGVTRLSSSTLDESGAYGDWPEDFADTELAVDSEYLSS